MTTLHYDYCRCAGTGCDRKAECLRVAAMQDMGPNTPKKERLCEGNTAEAFISIHVEETK